MFYTTSKRLGLAVPLALLSTTAFADLTPQDVWGDMRGYLESMGYQMTATETANGTDLSVTNIQMVVPIPDTGGSVSLEMENLTFADNGDGSVSVVFPDALPITIKAGENGQAPEFDAVVNYGQSGQSMVVSGNPDQMTYAYTADTVTLTLASVVIEGAPYDPEKSKFSLTGNNVVSNSTVTIGDLRQTQQNMTIGSITYDLAFSSPDDSDAASMSGFVNTVTAEGSGSIPPGIAGSTDMGEMIKAGFDIISTLTFASSSANISVTDRNSGETAIATTSDAGSFEVTMGTAGLGYDISQDNVQINVASASLPFPVEIGLAQAGFNLGMPVLKSDDSQDIALGLQLIDFTVSDMIWSMLDPGAQLDRGPATIDLDLTGKVKMLVDILDPEAAGQLGFAPPAQPESLALNRLNLAVAGASAQASGAFTINPDGPPMIPGVGAPVGELNVAVAGANQLMDTLISMGLLQQEDAMGARMMMGLLGVPGDAPDTLTSKIEVTEDGQVLANGQRIQ